MDPSTTWYGSALLIGLVAPWGLSCCECRRLGLDLSTARRVSGAVFWGVIYTVVAFAWCIDIARVPVNQIWGLVMLATAMTCSPFWMFALSHGWPVWVRPGRED
jgi:hypothetical protein